MTIRWPKPLPIICRWCEEPIRAWNVERTLWVDAGRSMHCDPTKADQVHAPYPAARADAA